MLDFPYDIWEYITSFLSSEEVEGLLEVNQALFNIAMNERYRTSTIGPVYQKSTQRSLKRLIDPTVAARVRTLVLKPGSVCKFLKEQKAGPVVKAPVVQRGRASRQKQITRMTMNIPLDKPIPQSVAEAEATLPKIMSQLTILTRLEVEISCADHWNISGSLLRDMFSLGWPCFGRTLQTLDLKVPLEDMELVLPNGGMEHLEAISLQIIRASVNAEAQPDKVLLEALLPLLQNLHRLRSLTLDVAEHLNLSPLLNGISLPLLKRFKLVQPRMPKEEADFTGLHRFFRKHRTRLIDLEIATDIERSSVFDVVHEYDPFIQPCFSVSFPKLQSLAVHHPIAHHPTATPDSRDAALNSTINYIHQFKSSLLSLTVTPTPFSLGSLKCLVEGFIVSARLQTLVLSILVLSPETISVLSANLPNLEVLELATEKIDSLDNVYSAELDRRVPQFAQEMRQLYFPQWQLKALSLFRLTFYPLITSREHDKECKAALLEALPHVETFGGLDRETYLERGDFLPKKMF